MYHVQLVVFVPGNSLRECARCSLSEASPKREITHLESNNPWNRHTYLLISIAFTLHVHYCVEIVETYVLEVQNRNTFLFLLLFSCPSMCNLLMCYAAKGDDILKD
jgi:hypothetical protein